MELDTTIYNLSSVLQMCRFTRAVFNALIRTHTHFNSLLSRWREGTFYMGIYLFPGPALRERPACLATVLQLLTRTSVLRLPLQMAERGNEVSMCTPRDPREREGEHRSLYHTLCMQSWWSVLCWQHHMDLIITDHGSIDSSVPIHVLYNVHFTQHLTCINFRCADLPVD